MSKQTTPQADPEVKIETAIGKTEQFIENNWKKILTVLGALVVIAGLVFGFNHLYKAPRENKANELIYTAQQHFAEKNYELALNGDDTDAGFIEVIDRYGSTAAGNIAKHYAGICEMQLGNYESAIEYLKKYSAVRSSAGAIINAQNKGLIGDAYVQLQDLANAEKYYQEAVKTDPNDLTTPYYLKKLGGIYEQNQDYAKALKSYEEIQNIYPSSLEARDIAKYIGRASQQTGK